MSLELFSAFILFALVTLFTPGPNNVMLMASGLNFGPRGALPHLLGVALGFPVMVFILGVGLGAIFNAWPLLHTIIKYVGAAYLLYLAWKIAASGPVATHGARGSRPITFLQAVAFQWANPKGWVMAVGAIATYVALASFPLNMAIIAVVFGVLGLISAAAWVLFGSALRRFIRDARAVKILNLVMAGLLVVSVVPAIVADWI